MNGPALRGLFYLVYPTGPQQREITLTHQKGRKLGQDINKKIKQLADTTASTETLHRIWKIPSLVVNCPLPLSLVSKHSCTHNTSCRIVAYIFLFLGMVAYTAWENAPVTISMRVSHLFTLQEAASRLPRTVQLDHSLICPCSAICQCTCIQSMVYRLLQRTNQQCLTND